MAIVEMDRRRILEARRDAQQGPKLSEAAPAPLAEALRFAGEQYQTAQAALMAAGEALVSDQLETDAQRKAVLGAASVAEDHYRFVRNTLNYSALNPPPGQIVDAAEQSRRAAAIDRLTGLAPARFSRLGTARQIAHLNRIIANLPGANLPGVAGAPWLDALSNARDALQAAADELARETREDTDAQAALDAARVTFDRAQLVYEGLAEATLRHLDRLAELPKFVYRRDPRYRAALRAGKGLDVATDAGSDGGLAEGPDASG